MLKHQKKILHYFKDLQRPPAPRSALGHLPGKAGRHQCLPWGSLPRSPPDRCGYSHSNMVIERLSLQTSELQLPYLITPGKSFPQTCCHPGMLLLHPFLLQLLLAFLSWAPSPFSSDFHSNIIHSQTQGIAFIDSKKSLKYSPYLPMYRISGIG